MHLAIAQGINTGHMRPSHVGLAMLKGSHYDIIGMLTNVLVYVGNCRIIYATTQQSTLIVGRRLLAMVNARVDIMNRIVELIRLVSTRSNRFSFPILRKLSIGSMGTIGCIIRTIGLPTIAIGMHLKNQYMMDSLTRPWRKNKCGHQVQGRGSTSGKKIEDRPRWTYS